MLINLSNHSSVHWNHEQLKEASKYGEIVDLDFPGVDPFWSEPDIQRAGKLYAEKCIELIGASIEHSAVHIMGEMTFSYFVISLLKAAGVTCLASTTLREAASDGSLKLSEFRFVRFRRYVS